jgi:hypothetical protein
MPLSLLSLPVSLFLLLYPPFTLNKHTRRADIRVFLSPLYLLRRPLTDTGAAVFFRTHLFIYT